MILIELTAAVDSIGTLRTFYLSTEPFVTAPTDTPAHVAFVPALIDAGSLGVAAYSDGRTGGASKLEVGEIVVANADGAFDAWLNYGFDGRPLTIRSGTGGAYPTNFPAVLAATVEGVEADFEKLIIRLRDRQYLLQKPVLTNRYKGDNVAPNGLEGAAGDLKDKPKPRVLGKVFNIAPPQVNAAKLTYQVNDGPVGDIPAVYDRGAALSRGANYATSAALQAATPGAGSYVTCLAEGYFRLGSSPVGQVTADVIEGRVNLLSWSEGFSQSAWQKAVATVASDVIAAPDGTLSADKLDDQNTTTADTRVYRTVTIPNDKASYVFSLYLKAGTAAATRVDIGCSGGTATGSSNTITWTAGQGALSRTGDGTASLTALADGWHRLAVNTTNNASGNTTFTVSIRPAGQGASLTGSCYAWGAQLERGLNAGSYLPTGASLNGGRSVAEVLTALAQGAGVPAAEISTIQAAVLDIENPAVVGLYLEGEETFQAAMDEAAAGIGAYYAFDAAGALCMGRLTPPAGAAKAAIKDYDCLDGLERRPAKDTGTPVWRATVRHSKLWAVQASDLAGAVSADRRAYLAQAFRDETAEDANVQTQFLMAGEMVVESLLTDAADAAAEAARLLAVHKVRRDVFEVPVPLETYARWVDAGLGEGRLRMMSVVSLTLNRFGLGTGKTFRLIGVRLELAQQRAILTLWG